MEVKRVVQVYFSPTGSTQKIIKEITEGLDIDYKVEYDLTKPEIRANFQLQLESNDLLLVGVPVYEEQLPKILKPALKNIKGDSQLAVTTATYGNIGYGITIDQLNEILRENGLNILGSAAFIGEHSFSNSELKIAAGRPDDDDLLKAEIFGRNMANKIYHFDEKINMSQIKVEGSLPLISKILPQGSINMFADLPQIDQTKCNECGSCIEFCPVQAIDSSDYNVREKDCIRCFACVKQCPNQARTIDIKKKFIAKKFLKLKGSQRKEPEFFY